MTGEKPVPLQALHFTSGGAAFSGIQLISRCQRAANSVTTFSCTLRSRLGISDALTQFNQLAIFHFKRV
jgi:hypothetical protein